MSEGNTGQIYPWHHLSFNDLSEKLNNERLPHGLLFTGPKHCGKTEFGFALAAYLLCKQPGEVGACGSCSACALVDAGSHPDLKVVQPIESKQIKIDEVRLLVEWSNQTAQQGGRKVALIFPAEAMNLNAANALLKSLEEPPAGTYLILVSHEPRRILPTIRSRCQLLPFGNPSEEQGTNWLVEQGYSQERAALLLSLAAGSPIRAISQFDQEFLERRDSIIDSVVKMLKGDAGALQSGASLVDKERPAEVYEVLYDVFSDVLKMTLSDDYNSIKNKDIRESLDVIQSKLGRAQIIQLCKQTADARRLVTGVNNPNTQLLLESLSVSISRSVTA